MHRSGTSALTRALNILGLGLPENLLPAAADNTNGYFESRDLVRLNQELLTAAGTDWHDPAPIPEGWFASDQALTFQERARTLIDSVFSTSNILVLKDPRLCRLLPFWRARFAELEIPVACVLILRDPREVAQSLQARVLSEETRPAGALSVAKGHWLWLRYVLDGEYHSRGIVRCFLTYDALLGDWQLSLSDVAHALRLQYPVSFDKVRSALEESLLRQLKRQRSADAHPLGWPTVAVSLYQSFEDHVRRHHDLDLARLDDFRQALRDLREPAEAAQNSGIHAYSLRHSDVLTNLGRARSGLGACPRVLYVSGCPETRGHLYRVDHHVQALQAGGVDAGWCAVPDVNESRLSDISIVVIFRAMWDQRLSWLYEFCRRRGVKVGFDVDDLVFDPDYMCESYFDYLRRLSSAQREEWSNSVAGWRQSLLNADFATVSTKPLADAATRMGKPAYVWPNGLSWGMVENSLRWSSHLSKPSHSDGRIRLGYTSGTPTHQKDFGQITTCLAALLAEIPETILTVVGHLDLTEFPELVAHRERIEVRPYVSHSQLAAEYARFDVNLAPLQAGNPFCEGKSELKYFEAGAVRVPTVASATAPFRTAIRSGINGYCVELEAQWRKYLVELIEDGTARRRLGEEAYWHAMVRFGPEAQSLDGLKVLAELSANRD